jgi:hypothetical protein
MCYLSQEIASCGLSICYVTYLTWYVHIYFSVSLCYFHIFFDLLLWRIHILL